MDRKGYLVRRLLLAIPTFIGITMLCFALTRALPGGPVEIRLARMRAIGGGNAPTSAARVASVTEEQRAELNRQFGFDQPFLKQYLHWLVDDRMGLMMSSYDYPDRTAWDLVSSRFPVSLTFGVAGAVLSYLVCIPLGIAKALRNGSRFDAVSSLVVFAGYALPSFAAGMLLKTLFCGTVDSLWDVFPLSGFESLESGTWTEILADRVRHMFLPVLCYVIGNFAVLTLMMKNSLLDQIGADYIRTVMAKGATMRRAVWLHALRNAMIPIATGFGSILMVLFAGSVVIEQVFEIPGMGRLSLSALDGRDYAVFMAILSLTATAQLLGNLLSDICYMLIDPRISFDRG